MMVQVDENTFVTSDLNDLYQRVISRCNRLKRLAGSHESVIRDQQHLLQEEVTGLFDNSQLSNPVTRWRRNRPLMGFVQLVLDIVGNESNLLEGMLRRPVDYSAQTRLVVAHTDDIDIALLPESLAWNLFRPVVIWNLSKHAKITSRY